MKKQISRRSFVGLGIGAAAASAAVLPKWSSIASAQDDATPMASPTAANAQVRVVHASPDAPGVDIYVNGDLAIENLEFGAATPFVELPAGEYQIQVTPTGSDVADSVIDATVPFEGGFAYNVAAVGRVADITALAVEITTSSVPEGKARIGFIHASPDAPAVDIAVTDGPILFENAEFPSASEYIEVDAGTYDLEVRPTGTEDVALPLPGVALADGVIYDVFAIGTIEEGTLGVLVLESEPAM